MILLIHRNAEQGIKVLRDEEELIFDAPSLCDLFWNLAGKCSQETIVWIEEALQAEVNLDAVPEILNHNLIMASYAVRTRFLPDTIGYIDQMPFVRVNREVRYGTWQMSSDIGAIKAETLLRFKPLFKSIRSFDFLLNSIAKLGQQNGLFCYSAPTLWNGRKKSAEGLEIKASKTETFDFVHAHYKSIRTFLLFWSHFRYENSVAIGALTRSLFRRKYFREVVDFSGIEIVSRKNLEKEKTVDVIIPTIGRREYLLHVLEDLKAQTHLPKRVVVVEQNPNEGSTTDLPELRASSWPFEVVHHFTHTTGACRARNIALEEVNSNWIFFADDDVRLEPEFLGKVFKELDRFNADQLTFDCRQEGEPLIFDQVKQWGSFGSGNSIVSEKFASKVRFDPVFEYGYGEDKDYGMQLRAAGCDIIYHPEIQILHLKAPRGGFREVDLEPWEKDRPKPSPTLMLLALKYFSQEQLKGYRVELFLRYFFEQKVRNPVKYLKMMKQRWATSERWASKLTLSNNKFQ